MSWSIRTHLQRCFIPDDLRHAHLQIFCKVKSLRSAFLCFRRCRIVYFFVGGPQKSISFVPTCTNIIKWSFEQENTISCARLGLLCDGTKNLAPPSGAGFLNAIIPVSIDEDACGSWHGGQRIRALQKAFFWKLSIKEKPGFVQSVCGTRCG